jgi:hypothetical protein
MTKRVQVTGGGGAGGMTVSIPDVNEKQPTEQTRRQHFLKGAERLRADFATLEKLGKLHEEISTLENELSEPAQAHVAIAAAAAGKVLFKTLGADCFKNATEAAAWAKQHLPLTDARARAKGAAVLASKLNHRCGVVRQTFWKDAGECAAKIVPSRTLDRDRAIDETISFGAFK